MSIKIVPTMLENLAAYRAALDEVARERTTIAWLEAPPIEYLRASLSTAVERGHPHFVVLDTDEPDANAVVGWCSVTPKDRDVNRHVGVLGIAIRKAWRGKGLGHALMRSAIDAGWARGLTRIELVVHHDNAQAIALYQRLGFEREGLQRRAAIIDGREIDCVMMGLLKMD